MKWRRIRAMTVKESLQIVRDPRSLMIALLIPVLQMLLLGYGISLDLKLLPLCAYDQDNTTQSRDLLQRFSASAYFETRPKLNNYAAVRRGLDTGSCLLAIVIPSGFSKGLADNRGSTVQVLLDATDTNTASLAANYARAVISGYSTQVQIGAIQSRGGQMQTAAPVQVRARVWFNEDLISRNFIIPGVVAMVMAIVGSQLSSLTIAREWERGTMELLISTPVQRLELMVGKLLPYFVVGLLDACICLALAMFWFDIPFRGTFVALLLTTGLFLLVVLCIGYYVSVSIRSQVGASQVALILTMLPTTLLSGFSFPIDQMPPVVQGVTYLVSGRYYVALLKALFLKGASWSELAAPMVCLAVYSLVMVVLAARAFHKSLD